MIVCVQQCAAVEGDREEDLEVGCCCRAIEEGTALLCAIVHSAAYVVHKDDREDCVNPSVARKTLISMGFG